MDNESYDQFPMDQGQVAETLDFIVEQMEVDLIFFKGTPITLELPITVDLKVINSPPGVRGDTATGASKEATVETGLMLQVPLFVKEGDVIKIDTRTGQYISRS